jgi:hypothetical protein
VASTGYSRGVELFGVAVTVIAMVAIAFGILLFERRRARQIESGLRDQAEVRRNPHGRDDSAGG